MLTIRSHASDPAIVTVAELPDGVNEPASITFIVRNYHVGKLAVHIVGGDPDQGEGDYPTVVEGTWDEHSRKFNYGEDQVDAISHARRTLEQIINFLSDEPEAQTLARESLANLNAAENTAWKES